MPSRHPVGLMTLVAVPLLLFLGVFLLMTVLLFFAFRDIQTVLGQTLEQQTPFVTHATALVRQSERLRSMVFRLLQTDSRLVWESLADQIQAHLAEGRESARNLRKIGLYPDRVERLQSQMERLSAVVARTDSFMTAWIDTTNLRLQLTKSLRALACDIEDMAARQPGIAAWHRASRLLILDLLALSTPIDASYGLRLKADIEALQRQADQILRHLPEDTLPAGEREQLVRMHLLLMSYADRDGVVQLFERARMIHRQYAEATIETDALAESITINAGELLQDIHAELAGMAGDVDSRMKRNALVILFSVLLAFLTCYAAYRHFLHKVVRPVLSLYNVLRLRTSGSPARIRCDEGALEVREVARALSWFVATLEEREQELRESHAHLEDQVRERTAELRHLSQRLLRTREEERFRLAAELHDDIGATVSVIKLGIERALLMLARQGQNPEAQAPLKEAIDLIKGMARQLRRIQYDLRPAHLDVGFLPSLNWFCEDYRLAHPGLSLDLRLSLSEQDIPVPLRIVLFRLVQESLNNVAKHSGAHHVEIRIHRTPSALCLRIADDGRGFSPPPPGDAAARPDEGGGNGLRNMRERVELSGGRFRIDSAPGRGTRICAVWKTARVRTH